MSILVLLTPFFHTFNSITPIKPIEITPPMEYTWYPYLAGVYKEAKRLCTAALIQENLALTSSKCVQNMLRNLKDSSDLTPAMSQAHIASYQPNFPIYYSPASEKRHRPTYLLMHDKTTNATSRLALIKTGSESKQGKGIHLDRYKYNFKNGAKLTLIGFTKAFPTSPNFPLFSSAEIKIISAYICSRVLHMEINEEETFCAQISPNTTLPCLWSPGSLVIRETKVTTKLIGILETTPECHSTLLPLVLLRLQTFYPWLNQTIQDLKPKPSESPTNRIKALNFLYNNSSNHQKKDIK
ncbi:hypothetical protein DSO57_1030790 [Entomophthora muscae]|uniref:Uncharacterized protein n=1 Tax=Entomophthora muscae TaxID=34485 RepID=A0ACC2S2X9_9FUNG|nr:hypothetical protein DSO57_1030790 [Entomophthora muscae]